MKALPTLTLAVIVPTVVATSTALAQACAYQTLEPGVGKILVGSATMDLGMADDTVNPQAWQGPVVFTHADGSSCTADPDVSLVERPLFSDGQRVIVSTYSGGERRVHFLDINNCRILWKSSPFSGEVSLTPQALRLGTRTHKLGALCIPSAATS
ncbi:hypothetical protein [Nitrospirillum pindoramense]|uniref:Uncharacterized protein n=1 Tax=Nitrospirillum amazonense TaxID=28077 RepID=A0A560HJI0_9PROT|nr:hypothetical protein [Nitrospirillum amazonense]TWB45699.1 hypothetical protein FBZ90_10131 [Nitrospirillum amazonense]